MKKCLSMILAFVMMLTMLPMGVLAAEEGNTERDAIIAQACEVFPEYAAMIRGEISSLLSLTTLANHPGLFIKRRVLFQKQKR